MFRFAFRVLGLWILAGGFAAAVIDGMKSIAASTIVTTPALATWTDLAPTSHTTVRTWLERVLGPSVATLLDDALAHAPTWALLGVVGVVLVALSLPRDEDAPIGGRGSS